MLTGLLLAGYYVL